MTQANQHVIYLAAHNSGATLSSFRERGHPELMPGQVSEQTIIALKSNGGLFNMRMSNIGEHADAFMNNKSSQGIGALKTALFQMTVPKDWFYVPVAAFVFDKPSEETKTMIMSHNLQAEPGKATMFTGSPTPQSLKELFGAGLLDTRIAPGTVSAKGYLAYVSCLRVMNFFSFVSGQFTSPFGTMSGGSMGKSYNIGDEHAVIIPTGGVMNGGGSDIGSPLVSLTSGILAEVIQGRTEYAGRIPEMFSGLDLSTARPSLPGVVFPYFNGMCIPDKSMVMDVFQRRFFKLINEDPASAMKMWSTIREGLRSLANFSSGQAISHAFRGIELCCEVGGSITFIVEQGAYHGFIIQHQQQLEFLFHGKVYSSVPQPQLIATVATFNKHRVALEGMCALLNTGGQGVGKDYARFSFSITQIDSSRKLANILHRLERSCFLSATFDDELQAIIATLAYGDVYPVPTPSLIQAYLEFVDTGNTSILEEFPAFLASSWYQHKDRVFFGLGMFGPFAPSLNYGSGSDRIFTIPRPSANDTNIELVDGKMRLQYLPFKMEPIHVAAIAWKSLFVNGSIRIPAGIKEKEFTDRKRVKFIIGSGTPFNIAYGRIKSIVHSFRGDEEGAGSKKRKLDKDSDDKSSSKKKMLELRDMM